MLRCCCRVTGLFLFIVFVLPVSVFAAQTAVSDAGSTSIDDANSQQYGVEVSGGNAIVLTVSNGVNINSFTPAPSPSMPRTSISTQVQVTTGSAAMLPERSICRAVRLSSVTQMSPGMSKI